MVPAGLATPAVAAAAAAALRECARRESELARSVPELAGSTRRAQCHYGSTRSAQHAAHSVRRATYIVQHATYSMQHATHSIQHAAHSVQRARRATQLSRHTTCDARQHRNVHHTTRGCNMHHTTHAQPTIPCRSPSDSSPTSSAGMRALWRPPEPESRRRCGRGEPSPGADVAGASPVRALCVCALVCDGHPACD